MLETIKEYLVGLGFEVDKASLGSAKKAMSELEGTVKQFLGSAVKTFGEAAVAVAGFGLAVNAATTKLMDYLGNQEISMEMLSRQLWTTQQQANAFNGVLKAMNTNLQSLYLSPTLMSQYEKLHGVAMQMNTPGDYSAQIKQVQDLQLQFKQLRLEGYYALQWIGYYFVKYMSGPINNVKNVLQSINAVIVKQMPNWTKVVAQWMVSFEQAGMYIVQGLGDVWKWLEKLAQYVPGWAKAIAAGLAIFSISNPFMLWTEAIGGLLLLLDDFQTYLHGGNSEFPKFWSWMVKIGNEFKKSGDEKRMLEGLKTALDDIGTAAVKVGDFIVKLYETFQKNGTLKEFGGLLKTEWAVFKDWGKAISSVVNGIGHLFGVMNDSKQQSGALNFFQLLADLFIGIDKAVMGASDDVAQLAIALGDLIHGKFSAAGHVIKDLWTGQNLANAGIIPQSAVSKPRGSSSSQSSSTLPASGHPLSGSYSYMYHTSHTSSTSHSTKTLNAPITVNQTINGVSNPQQVQNQWYTGVVNSGQQIIAAFRGIG